MTAALDAGQSGVLEAALQYAVHGMAPVPLCAPQAAGCSAHARCSTPGKRPIEDAWHDRATTDPNLIRDRFASHSGNLGLLVGPKVGVFALDVDQRHGGLVSLGNLDFAYGTTWRETPTQRTGGGGFHIIFRRPAGVELRGDLAHAGLPGIEVKGNTNHQIVAAPSVHASGRAYVWDLGFDDVEIAEPPEWLLEVVARRHATEGEGGGSPAASRRIRNPPAFFRSLVDTLRSAAEGERNNRLNDAAFAGGQCIPGGWLDRADVESALQLAAEACGLPTGEVRATVRSGIEAGILAPFPEKPRAAEGAPPLFSEEALTQSFVSRHENDLKHCAVWGKWYRWHGGHWSEDKTTEVFDFARSIVREAASEAGGMEQASGGGLRTAQRLASAKTVAAVEKMARSDRKFAVVPEAWDTDPWALNTPGGVVDLRTGETRPHAREDLCTKQTTVTPAATGGPTWCRFLDRVTGGDVELQGFLQRVAGYSLTGVTSEHALFFFYGTGGNGKGVFLNTLTKILGSYTKVSPMETFTVQVGSRHETELAMLRGARLVTAQETEEGRQWAEARIKALTGGDPITARFMRADFFTFDPQFKLVIAGNHKPGLRNVDEAMRRRLHLVPFDVTIPPEERDPRLPTKLEAEWPAILAWAVEGCLEWQRSGLRPPERVRDETREYFESENVIDRWFRECAIKRPEGRSMSSQAWASWRGWAKRNGEAVGSQRSFTQRLAAAGIDGIERRKSVGQRVWFGFDIPMPTAEPDPRDRDGWALGH